MKLKDYVRAYADNECRETMIDALTACKDTRQCNTLLDLFGKEMAGRQVNTFANVVFGLAREKHSCLDLMAKTLASDIKKIKRARS